MAPVVATQLMQSSLGQRELRHNIRNLTATVQRQGDDLADINNLPQISTVLQELNSYHAMVEKPREQVEDSNCLMLISNKAADMAKKVAQHRGTEGPRECVQLLRRLFSRPGQPNAEGSGTFSWTDFSEAIERYFQPAPGVSCINGPMDAEVKMRKAPVRRDKKKPVGEARRAEELIEQETDKQASDKLAEEIDTVLSRVQSTGFLELVMNHNSFSQTVENIFALSFLVRDGRARLGDSENGMVVHHNTERKKGGSEDRDRMQFIISYSMEDWASWRSFVLPQNCLVKNREDVQHAPTGGRQTTLQARHSPLDDEDRQEEDEEEERPSRAQGKRRKRL